MSFEINPKELSLQDAAGMQLVNLIRRVAKEGDAKSLAELSDVTIENPEIYQFIMIDSVSGRTIHFKNASIYLANIKNVESSQATAGKVLLARSLGHYYFDFVQCTESPTLAESITEGFEQIISTLKPAAKSAGKAGAKVSVPNASNLISSLTEIQDTRKRVPVAIFGDYTFFPKGRISSTKYLFSSADTDADGLYDIIFAIDSTANAAYVTVTYTACPAMS